MNDIDQLRLVLAAQNQIRDILIQLEESAGVLVDEICIFSMDVTTVGSSSPEYLRQVEVKLQKQANNRWA